MVMSIVEEVPEADQLRAGNTVTPGHILFSFVCGHRNLNKYYTYNLLQPGHSQLSLS